MLAASYLSSMHGTWKSSYVFTWALWCPFFHSFQLMGDGVKQLKLEDVIYERLLFGSSPAAAISLEAMLGRGAYARTTNFSLEHEGQAAPLCSLVPVHVLKCMALVSQVATVFLEVDDRILASRPGDSDSSDKLGCHSGFSLAVSCWQGNYIKDL